MIQPSQLYISSEKLARVMASFEPQTSESLLPVPLKRLGSHTIYTDGHTRAFAAYSCGLSEIRAYWDEDDLDWEMYKICIAWCLAEGIRTIADLKGRVVPPKDYETLWRERCRKMHREVIARRSSEGSGMGEPLLL